MVMVCGMVVSLSWACPLLLDTDGDGYTDGEESDEGVADGMQDNLPA